MIRVCLIGKDTAKEKALLESRSDIDLYMVELGDFEDMLDDIARSYPHVLVISDVCGGIDADALCMHTYLRSPETKTLIISDTEADYHRLEATGFSCKGFMLHQQRHAIVRAVNVINDGESWLSRKLVTTLLNQLATGALSGKRKLQLVKHQ
ncbi:response regulator transcription factor [Methylophaga thiooxydans]|uniref:Response regulatory domain-containing protein n=1 Tax=Methylophaga thiooxydans DMS010 TaxID=637616 RepID=C0N8P4_9GAMM|nr:response regulator transcription factor [Methylophaga thiooxydans]EEF78859.1 hypothetical protein MDMS009_2603 [Methylophaga thiooxydans DMS010]